MLRMFEKAVLIMAVLRLFSGSVEIMAAGLMLWANDIEKALVINGSLALIGPIILILTTGFGLMGLCSGVILILAGVHSK